MLSQFIDWMQYMQSNRNFEFAASNHTGRMRRRFALLYFAQWPTASHAGVDVAMDDVLLIFGVEFAEIAAPSPDAHDEVAVFFRV